MSMKGGHQLYKKITIKDTIDENNSENEFHPYTKEVSWGFTDYGFFVGLGPPPPRGHMRFQDFFCTVDKDNGKITKIEKIKNLLKHPVGNIKTYLDKFENIEYNKGNPNKYDNAYETLDNMLNESNADLKKYKPNEYYIFTFDEYRHVKLLTHKVPFKIKSSGGKRKTRRVKKSNRKSNRKRRSNTKRHTRKH